MVLDITRVKPVQVHRVFSGTKWEHAKGPKAGATKLASLSSFNKSGFPLTLKEVKACFQYLTKHMNSLVKKKSLYKNN